MKESVKRNFARLNGLLAIIFGLVALLFPGITLAALGIYFSVSIIIGGIMLISGSFRVRKSKRHWYFLFLEGIIGILIGIIILARPEIVATVFVTIIGLWALIIGLVFLFSFFKSHLPALSNTFILIGSIFSVVVGLIIIINPFESTRLITVFIGIYALIYGLFSLINTSRIVR